MNIGSLGGQSLSQLYASVYTKMDADSSGEVTTDELTQALSSKSGSNSAAQTSAAQKLFSAMDSDTDGSLTSTEVSSYFQSNLSLSTLTGAQGAERPSGPPPGPPPSGGPGGAKPPELSDIDSDKDGSISKSEMQTYAGNTLGDEETTKADAIFSVMDTDQDGAVSAAEKTAFDDQMAAKKSEGNRGPHGAGGPPPGYPPKETADSTSLEAASTTGTDALVQKLTAQWLQSLYANLSSGASSLTDVPSAGSSLSVSA